jgi:pyrroloquinoline quinone (PQQ) biosynthesis protein C
MSAILSECNEVATSEMTLDDFLIKWDKDYHHNIAHLPIFDKNQTSKWTVAQQQYFVKTFYHVRGHFHDVLWYMGNFAPNKEMKELILENIRDEFNGNAMSHEYLYILFAKAVGVDLEQEFVKEESYLPFIKEFNHGHINWLRSHDWDERLACFAALERLDNLDYKRGKAIAESLRLKNSDLVFFNVHIQVEHFSPIFNYIQNIWNSNPKKIQLAFSFIMRHHATMWDKLSKAIFNYQDDIHLYGEQAYRIGNKN